MYGCRTKTAEEVSRFQCLLPNANCWCVRASHHQELAPTFPGIDSCHMVTKRDFLEIEASLCSGGVLAFHLFRIRLFHVRLFRVRLFRVRLFRVRLFRVLLSRVCLFRVRLFRICLFCLCLFRVPRLQPNKLRITRISFSALYLQTILYTRRW